MGSVKFTYTVLRKLGKKAKKLTGNKDTVVFYHFYPSTADAELNLATFLERAIFDQSRDYFLNLVDSPQLDMPAFEHIKVLRYQNTDADFGGLSAFIDEHGDELKGKNLFIANSSVAGPFTPPNYPLHWIDVFSSRLKDNVGAVGTSISFLPETSAHAKHYFSKYQVQPKSLPHIQTFAYLLSAAALEFLMSSGFFKRTFASDREEIISGYELRLSQILLEADWGIDSVTHPGAPIFSSTPVHNVFENSDGDCMQEGSYFGETLHPYESVFIKTRRYGLETKRLLISIANRHRHLNKA